MQKYKLLSKKGEGTFSEVIKAQRITDGSFFAIKCMKNHFDSIEQVNDLREIQCLRRLSPHPNIIPLEEVLFDQSTGRLALIFELMDANLYDLIRGRNHPLNTKIVKSYMYQLLSSLAHMHDKGIFHRDIKPENILIEKGSNKLKLADFGSCRGVYSKKPYTEYISTRWYRAPECLLTDGHYGPEMDIWGAGCVFFEIIALHPLFPGSDEIDQINRIHKILGSPAPHLLMEFRLKGAKKMNFNFPHSKNLGISHLLSLASEGCIDLVTKTLKYDASQRITAKQSIDHPYIASFADYHDKAKNSASTNRKQTNKTTKVSENSSTRKGHLDNKSRVTPPKDLYKSKQKSVLGNSKNKNDEFTVHDGTSALRDMTLGEKHIDDKTRTRNNRRGYDQFSKKKNETYSSAKTFPRIPRNSVLDTGLKKKASFHSKARTYSPTHSTFRRKPFANSPLSRVASNRTLPKLQSIGRNVQERERSTQNNSNLQTNQYGSFGRRRNKKYNKIVSSGYGGAITSKLPTIDNTESTNRIKNNFRRRERKEQNWRQNASHSKSKYNIS